MKRLVLVYVLAVLTHPLLAQETKRDGMSLIISYQPNWFGGDVLGGNWQGRIMFPVAKRLNIGGGTLYEKASFDEIEDVKIPFRKLRAGRFDVGLTADVQYLFAKQEEQSHSVHLQLSAKYSKVGFSGEDIRAEKIVDFPESGSTVYSYSLNPGKDSWRDGWFASTIRLSYVYDYGFLHIEVGVGYDLTRSIKKELLNKPSTLASSWEDFDLYYPSVTVNPFTEYGCEKKTS